MTKLTKISLTQFKSFLNQEFKFNSPFIAITGKNGIGKTNLLDAIYYLCYTKSYFNFKEAENVHYQTNGFRLESYWDVNNKEYHAICKYDLSKKQWWINDELLNKNNDYLGHFHAVMVAPDDINIINSGSDLRRRFVDGILAQEDGKYLQHLLGYQKTLAQKGAYLKATPYQNMQATMLDVYDTQLTQHSDYIIKKRSAFSDVFPKIVQDFYEKLSGNAESIDILYDCIINENQDIDQFYFEQRKTDLQLRRTTKGIHNEDWDFLMNGNSVKKFSSQGQKKTFLLALKLAQWSWLLERNIHALLLLDDLFEKIDQHRLQNLFSVIEDLKIEQVFFTHPSFDDVKKLMEEYDLDGEVIPLDEILK